MKVGETTYAAGSLFEVPPGAAGYGSLRARATDSDGNALEHNVIRVCKIA